MGFSLEAPNGDRRGRDSLSHEPTRGRREGHSRALEAWEAWRGDHEKEPRCGATAGPMGPGRAGLVGKGGPGEARGCL